MYYIYIIIAIIVIVAAIIYRYQKNNYPKFVGKVIAIKRDIKPNKSSSRDWNENTDITLKIHQVNTFFKKNITYRYEEEITFNFFHLEEFSLKEGDTVEFITRNDYNFSVERYEKLK